MNEEEGLTEYETQVWIVGSYAIFFAWTSILIWTAYLIIHTFK